MNISIKLLFFTTFFLGIQPGLFANADRHMGNLFYDELPFKHQARQMRKFTPKLRQINTPEALTIAEWVDAIAESDGIKTFGCEDGIVNIIENPDLTLESQLTKLSELRIAERNKVIKMIAKDFITDPTCFSLTAGLVALIIISLKS